MWKQTESTEQNLSETVTFDSWQFLVAVYGGSYDIKTCQLGLVFIHTSTIKNKV